MCPRISVPTSFSSSSSSSLPSPFLSLLLYTIRLLAVHVCARICIYLQKKKKEKNPTSAVYARGGELPSCTDTLLLALLLLLRFARTVIYLPIPFSTYNLHASIVQTDDGNYLRFSANAINQKRRSASPTGPLDRQRYPPPSPCRLYLSLALSLFLRLSTRLLRLIIHD